MTNFVPQGSGQEEKVALALTLKLYYCFRYGRPGSGLRGQASGAPEVASTRGPGFEAQAWVGAGEARGELVQRPHRVL